MLNVTIHQAGSGLCSLTNKEGEGLTVTFADGTVQNQFLTYKAFRQLLVMKLNPAKQDSKIPLALATNGREAATM
jgi:hypothetical protein